jgi:hypothetical protein
MKDLIQRCRKEGKWQDLELLNYINRLLVGQSL